MMALTVLGPLVLQSASSASQQPQVDTFGDLKKCVAKVVRGEGQAKYLEYAADGLKAGIDDINMRHVFQFGSKRLSSIGLTASDNTVAVASDFFAVRAVQLVDSSGNVKRKLDYIPWERMVGEFEDQEEEGEPLYWTARNTFDDEVILLYPTPDTSAAANYNARLEYFQRISQPSDDSDIIDAPRELSDVLCTYAQWHLLFIVDGGNPTRWMHKKQDYFSKLSAFKGSTKTDNPRQFSVPVGKSGYRGRRQRIKYVTS